MMLLTASAAFATSALYFADDFVFIISRRYFHDMPYDTMPYRRRRLR